MPLPPIDFQSVREHDGNRAKGFEELCCQLAALESRPADAVHIRKGPGADAGVECFTRFANGREIGWQVKYYWRMDGSLTGSLDESIKSALAKHPNLETYIVCIPFDISDPRTGTKKKPALQIWSDWQQAWIAHAAADGRSLDIQLWSAADLRERLSRDDPRYPGRLLYWFDTQRLTRDWFRIHFDEAKADLGNRYTAETSVALPVRRAILGLARDPGLAREVERWATDIFRAGYDAQSAMEHFAGHAVTPAPIGLEEAFRHLVEVMSKPLPNPTTSFALEDWQQALDKTTEATQAASNWCIRDDTDGTSQGNEAHARARSSLWTLGDTLEDTRTALAGSFWSHVNDRAVLVHGAGGIGKSHLLADVTAHQLAQRRPALLLLSQHFADDEPWPQIVQRLRLPVGTTADTFLGALDAAGQAAGVRALVLIDALNEKHGPRVWPDRLAGFLQQVERFPHVAVVLSCRTTYLKVVIPDGLDETKLPRLEHRGFSGDDARAYLKARHFVLPGTPFPAPEFKVPLFLKTCCDALEARGTREFPRGLRGTTALFDFYTTAIAGAIDRRLELAQRHRTVHKAVDALANLMIEAGDERLPVDRVLACFDELLRSQNNRDRDLLTQLESEGMLTVEAGTLDDVSSSAHSAEAVRFTFQRFSDHALATHLLDTHRVSAEPAEVFAEGGPLHHLVAGERAWRLSGVLEAMAVQLPERCGAELPDVVPDSRLWSVRQAFHESLLWREQATFTRRTLDLVAELLGDDETLRTLLRIATEPDNAFNAEHLHNRLTSWPMPERDACWSIPIAHLADDADGPVETLIDWAWTSGTEPMENRRAELAGITLTWMLTTSHRYVRDRATKALASLLTPRSTLAGALLDRFWPVDDDYLRERLLAAVYGALLQGHWSADGIGAIASHVHGMLFNPGPPPANALLRDHGRGIIEYAVWRKCLPNEIDPAAARPPYQSSWPPEAIADEVLDRYKNKSGRGVGFHDAIVSSSVRDGDFARYIIDYHVGHWSPAPIGIPTLPTDEEVWTQWRENFDRQASAEARAALEHLLACKAAVARLGIGEKTPETEAYSQAQLAFQNTVPPDRWEEFRSCSGIWRRTGMFSPHFGQGAASFDQSWARRWVCWRAHDLGWSEELHDEFDRGQLVSRDRMTHRVERIGKKYQWLALYELGARLADNCAFIGDRYGERTPGQYDGESFASLRGLDPSLLLSGTHDDGWSNFEGPCWWAPIRPDLRAMSAEDRLQWLYSENDWINAQECLDVIDPDGRQWLVLSGFVFVSDQLGRLWQGIHARRGLASRASSLKTPP